MQLQTVQRPSEGLAFDSVAPRETSTPHVAAAAFYHCLGEPFELGLTLQEKLRDEWLAVLATKGVLSIEQVKAYGEIIIKLA
jgi:hypothetical protein